MVRRRLAASAALALGLAALVLLSVLAIADHRRGILGLALLPLSLAAAWHGLALSSAVPRPPFVASGRLGGIQLAALDQIVTHPEVSRRTPVVLVHHPPVDDRIRLRVLRDGLVDLDRLRATLAPPRAGSSCSGISTSACAAA
jgi:hypothetical protein